MKRVLIAAAAAIVVSLAVVSGASAGKNNPFLFDLECEGHEPMVAASYGNEGQSDFVPAHIVGTNKVIIPVAISNVTGTFTDSEGTVTIVTEPDVARRAPPNVDLLDCHFSLSLSFPDGSTVAFEGDAEGYIVGK